VNPTSTIFLSRDELAVFIALLGLPTMNGLPPNESLEVSEQERSVRYNNGEFILQERGLLAMEDGGRIVLDDQLLAVAGSAAFPRATVMLSQVSPSGDSKYYFFSRGPELFVEHAIVRPGIFQFSHWCDYEALVKRVKSLTEPLLNFASPPADFKHLISHDTAARFLQCIANGKMREAAAALVENGFPSAAAISLETSLQHYPYWMAVAGWGFQDKEVASSKTAAFFPGRDSCWAIENMPQSASALHLLSVSGPVCQQQILDLLQVLK
jgi:hypothetical protein